MKYPKVIIIIFLAISFKAFANPKDSLIYLINTFKSTTEKIKAINALCEIEWLSAKYDTATILINQAFALEAKELALNSKNQIILTEKAKTFNNLAIIFRFKGDYSKSLDNHLKALKIRESINDKWGMARSYLGIGTIYDFTDKKDLALEYKFKAKKLFEEVKDTIYIGFTLNHIANLYFVKNDIVSAQKYNMQALMLFFKKFNATGIMDAYTLAGEIYNEQDSSKEAISNFEMALAVTNSLDLKDRVISLNINLANVYFKLKKYIIATNYLNTALEQCKQTGAKIHFTDIYKQYFQIDSLNGDFKSALKNYQAFIIYRDSLNNQTSSESIIKIQNAFENEKIEKQKQLEELKTELAHKNQLKQQSTIIYSGLIVLTILLGVVFIIYRNNLQRKKINNELLLKNETIAKQKKEVDEKQKEILDSIKYAKRIQQAHLPTEIFIEKKINKLKK